MFARVIHPKQLTRSPNQTVQRTGASRFTQGRIERHRRLAPVADLCVMPDLRMRRTAPAFLLLLTLLLGGCAAPDVKYAYLQPATTATVGGDTVTVHLGSDLK